MAASFEELGWRGYAFDSLQSRLGTLRATLLFGVLWSLWHLPLLFVKDSYQYVILQESPWYALNFFVSIVPLGVIMSQEALSMTQSTKCIETVVLAVVAAGIVMLDNDTFGVGTERPARPRLAGAVA